MTETLESAQAYPQTHCLYIHVPFCVRKCAYCDFFSIPAGDGASRAVNEWFDLIRRELVLWMDAEDPERRRPISTIYIGGGTPSYADGKTIRGFLEFVRSEFPMEPECEITIEMRPGTADARTIDEYAQAGVTRFSVGVQTFTQSLLDMAGRCHTVQQSREMLRQAAQAGILSADLISGWPTQTLDQWMADLAEILLFDPRHISVYEMTFHPNTPFGEQAQRRQIAVPDESLRIGIFEETSRVLSGAGYEQYEISNRARPGFRSRHNENYWKLGNYIGLGAGAHSFVFPHRYVNDQDIAEYTRAIQSGKLFRRLSDPPDHDMFIMENLQMALRLTDGVNLDWFAGRFGTDIRVVYGSKLSVLAEQGLAQISGGTLKLTHDGMMRMDSVIEYLL